MRFGDEDPVLWRSDNSETVPSLLKKAVAANPAKTFLDFEGKTYSFAQFDEETTRLAHGLQAHGVCKGEAVATFFDNSDDAVLFWFAINKLGAICVPLNTALKGEFLRHQLANCGARLLMCEGHYLARVMQVRDDLPGLERIFTRGVPEGEGSGGDIGLMRSDRVDPIDVEVTSSDLAFIIYTSGTTGPSKGCMVGHGYLCHYASQLAWALGLRDDDRMWTPQPLFHMGATGAVVLPCLIMGATFTLATKFSVSGFWPSIERSGATVTLTVGSMAVLLAEAPETEAEKRCFGQLRAVGGVPFPAELAQKWRSRFGVKHVGAPGYGMSELSMITLNPLSEPSPPGASGRRIPAVDVRVVDDHGDECPAGVAGEVIVRPRKPHVMFSGYYRQPEASLKAFENLWFHTGDLGRFDEDGFFFFVDRKKDYMRRRGENISSYELENAFRRHPAIEDLAAHAVPSEQSEDDVKITAILKPGSNLTEAELCRWSIDQVPFYAVPRYVEFRDDLPRNPLGRVLKYQLRDEGVTSATWDRESDPSIVVTR